MNPARLRLPPKIPLTAVERRFRDALLGAMIPGDPARGLPAFTDLDTSAFWAHFEDHAPPLLQFGFRAATVFVALEPVTLGFGARTLDRLSPDEREQFMEKLAARQDFLHRQLAMALKTTACFAYFREGGPRKAYDLTPPDGVPTVGGAP